jgi:2-polyprenyl-6-methoxyphenol hydroxylase-like FAD-dependent oxidoreductase
MQVNVQNPDVIIIGGGLSGLALLLTLGLHRITFAVVILATAVMAMSRLLYHAKVDPQLQKGKHDAKQ